MSADGGQVLLMECSPNTMWKLGLRFSENKVLKYINNIRYFALIVNKIFKILIVVVVIFVTNLATYSRRSFPNKSIIKYNNHHHHLF